MGSERGWSGGHDGGCVVGANPAAAARGAGCEQVIEVGPQEVGFESVQPGGRGGGVQASDGVDQIGLGLHGVLELLVGEQGVSAGQRDWCHLITTGVRAQGGVLQWLGARCSDYLGLDHKILGRKKTSSEGPVFYQWVWFAQRAYLVPVGFGRSTRWIWLGSNRPGIAQYRPSGCVIFTSVASVDCPRPMWTLGSLAVM